MLLHLASFSCLHITACLKIYPLKASSSWIVLYLTGSSQGFFTSVTIRHSKVVASAQSPCPHTVKLDFENSPLFHLPNRVVHALKADNKALQSGHTSPKPLYSHWRSSQSLRNINSSLVDSLPSYLCHARTHSEIMMRSLETFLACVIRLYRSL